MMSINLALFFANTSMHSVKATSFGNIESLYLDLIFSGDKGSVRLTGAAADMLDRTEAFFLTVEETDGEPIWHSLGGQTCHTEDLIQKWKGTAMAGLFQNRPRIVRFYRDLEDRERGLETPGELGGSAAIEFTASAYSDNSRVVLYATPEYPCSVQLVTNPQRCTEILRVLEAFDPGYV